MPATGAIPQPRPRDRVTESSRERLDEDCKRLLAAILELSLLLRHEPKREETQRQQASSRLGLDRAMQQRGLGARHATALLSVALYGPMTITQLAERHHVTVKTASLIAVELEDAGLIERREDPDDRRRTIVAIPIGKERVVDAGVNRRAAPLRRTLDRLSPPQRDGLITGLEVLAEEMSRDREPSRSLAKAEGHGAAPNPAPMVDER
jgi:DNA-binding MarR family transcriptional regulator